MEALDRRTFLKARGASRAPACWRCPAAAAATGEGAATARSRLRWSMWSDTPEERKIWQGLADAVTKKYPDIKVKLETTTFQNYWDKLQTQIASQTQADIVGHAGAADARLRRPRRAAADEEPARQERERGLQGLLHR